MSSSTIRVFSSVFFSSLFLLLVTASWLQAATVEEIETEMRQALIDGGYEELDDRLVALEEVQTGLQFTTGTSFADMSLEEAVSESTKRILNPETVVSQAVALTGVECFDYYHHDSVDAQFTPNVSVAVPGVDVQFSGVITNENTYPLVDGALYVKVFRARETGEVDVNGPDVVDQFFVAENINLGANESMPLSFAWKVPAFAVSGDYHVATFYTTSNKFNLLGLSFTDDIVGDIAPFTVVAEEGASLVSFNKEGVTVNDAPYAFAAFPPRINDGAPITVKALITNATDEAVSVPVRWQTYHWDAQQQENLVSEETRLVSVPANGEATAELTVTDTAYPVYLVTGSLTWNDTESYINVRATRSDVTTARLNFPAVTKYPLRTDEPVELFSCFHAVTADYMKLDGGNLTLTLLDEEGSEVHRYEYQGDITSSMMAIADTFIPERDYHTFTLKAELSRNGTLLEEESVTYKCEDLNDDAEVCADAKPQMTDDMESVSLPLWLSIGLIMLLLVGILWLMAYVKKDQTSLT